MRRFLDFPKRSPVGFGIHSEQADFTKRHSAFLERFSHITAALRVAFTRTPELETPADRVIFFSGRLCVEDFFEILLLCANGYGNGAQKILRGMYERAVTARYLHQEPAEVDNFLNFHWVQQRKLVHAIERTFGSGTIHLNTVEELENNYELVKDRFQVTDCKKCQTKRINHTWSGLDFVTMAKRTGDLGKMVVPGYYEPLGQAHSTAGAILSRLIESEDGTLMFETGAQRQVADQVLIVAHNLLLNALELQKDRFRLSDLDEPLQQCFQDFMGIWENEPLSGTAERGRA